MGGEAEHPTARYCHRNGPSPALDPQNASRTYPCNSGYTRAAPSVLQGSTDSHGFPFLQTTLISDGFRARTGQAGMRQTRG